MVNTADGVQVRLGADTSQATSGMEDAASSIQGSLDKLNSSVHDLGDKHAEAVRGMVESNEKAKDSFLGLSEAVRVRFGSVNSAFEQFRTKLAGVAESFAALAVARESVKALTSFEDDVRNLEITFGMTADKATQFSIALKLAGSDSVQYSEMLVRLGERLRTNQTEFDRLGVKIRDSNGHLLDAAAILQNVYKRMQDFKAGSDQDMMVMDLLGRGAREFSNEMSRLNQTQARAKELIDQLGISMGYEAQAKVERFRIEANAFKVTLEELSIRIGEQLLPGMERLTERVVKLGPDFLELGTQASKALADIGNGIATAFSDTRLDRINILSNDLKALSLTFAFARAGVMQWIDAIAGLARVQEVMQTAGDEANRRFLHLDFSGAIAAVKSADSQILADVRSTYANIKRENADYKQDRDEILFGTKSHPDYEDQNDRRMREGAGLPSSGSEGYKPPPTKGAGGGDDRLAQWRDQLEQMQEAEGFFHEMSKEQEADFWKEKLAIVDAALATETNHKSAAYQRDEKLRLQLNRLIFQDEKSAANQEVAQTIAKYDQQIKAAEGNEAKQKGLMQDLLAYVAGIYSEDSTKYQTELNKKLAMDDAWAKKHKAIIDDAAKFNVAMAKLEIQGEEGTLNQEVALRQVSADQKFAIEEELENKLYALDLKLLQDDLARMDQGTKAYQEQAEKIEILEVQHQQKLTAIARQAELERRKDELQATQDFQNDFASAIEQVVNGTKSLKQAFLDFFKQLDQQLVQLASNKIAQQLFGPGTSGGGFIQRIMGKIFGGGAAGGGTQATADQAATTAMTQLTAATTAQTADVQVLNPVIVTVQAAFQELVASIQSASTALMSMGGGGGIGDMFGGFGSSDLGGLGGFGGMFGFPMFASGTPYVPRDMLAIIHKGEAIIPAGMNRPGGNSSAYAIHNYFNITGGADARSQGQIAAAALHGIQMAARRHT